VRVDANTKAKRETKILYERLLIHWLSNMQIELVVTQRVLLLFILNQWKNLYTCLLASI